MAHHLVTVNRTERFSSISYLSANGLIMSGSPRTSAVRSVNAADAQAVGNDAKVLEARPGVAAEQQATPAAAAEPVALRKRRNPVLPVILAALFAGAAWYGYGWWTEGRFMVSTEDA